MPTITLDYTIPQSTQRLSAQTAALLGVALGSPLPDNELDMLGNIAESAARVVTAPFGPTPTLMLTLTYATTAEFIARFPTTATQIQAVSNLWTQRIGQALQTPVEAAVPVITP